MTQGGLNLPVHKLGRILPTEHEDHRCRIAMPGRDHTTEPAQTSQFVVRKPFVLWLG
jgi:hypothetical protein